MKNNFFYLKTSNTDNDKDLKILSSFEGTGRLCYSDMH